MKLLFKFHLIPILIAIILVFVITLFIGKMDNPSTKRVKGIETFEVKYQSNYSKGESAEINFVSPLRNKKVISLLGSSELTNAKLKYNSYDFLTDSMNMKVMAFGHAYHQCFSMYCQLLANVEDLKDANVCIILSPGWFMTEGTNIEAFLEFVPDNFFKKIINNSSISDEERYRVVNYVNNHYELINEPTLSLTYLNNLVKFQSFPFLSKWNNINKSKIENVDYQISLIDPGKPKLTDHSMIREIIKTDFIKGIKSNKLFINDEYYTQYLDTKDNPYESAQLDDDNFRSSIELEDFMALVKLLKKHNCNASFVFMPLHNLHYQGLEKFRPIKDEILSTLEKNNFPILDLFKLNKNEFEPGVLGDIMHFGDYGWTKVNQFIYDTYYKTIGK